MHNSLTFVLDFLSMQINSCVLINVKTQIVVFPDMLLIFERRIIGFERTHKIIPQVLTHLEGLNIPHKLFFYYLEKSEIFCPFHFL